MAACLRITQRHAPCGASQHDVPAASLPPCQENVGLRRPHRQAGVTSGPGRKSVAPIKQVRRPGTVFDLHLSSDGSQRRGCSANAMLCRRRRLHPDQLTRTSFALCMMPGLGLKAPQQQQRASSGNEIIACVASSEQSTDPPAPRKQRHTRPAPIQHAASSRANCIALGGQEHAYTRSTYGAHVQNALARTRTWCAACRRHLVQLMTVAQLS